MDCTLSVTMRVVFSELCYPFAWLGTVLPIFKHLLPKNTEPEKKNCYRIYMGKGRHWHSLVQVQAHGSSAKVAAGYPGYPTATFDEREKAARY